LNKREEDQRNYQKKLIEKYQYNPEIRKIKRHKQLPKYILNKKKELQIKKESKYRKQKNKELNSKLGSIEYQSEKNQRIAKTEVIHK
jgi:WD repeat and SOF domain-containing protein 1